MANTSSGGVNLDHLLRDSYGISHTSTSPMEEGKNNYGIFASWSPEDDQLLVVAHMLGLTWAEIEEDYLKSKTANACIERHEWLMMRRSASGWDSNKTQTLAKEYMSMHEEIWSGLAARVGENWRVIEEKCMSSDPETSQSTTDETGTISRDHPVKPTPIAGRVNQAKEAVPHICDVCQPPKTFTRAEHLRRHQLSHEPYEFSCPVTGCEKVFDRKELLDQHIERHGRLSMIKEYMSMRKEIWSGLAARIEEDWKVVEERCMSTNLNSLQKTARRLEILAKKAKLAELKAAREARMKQAPWIDQPIEALLMKVTDASPLYLSNQGMQEENTVAPYMNKKQSSKDLHRDRASITQPGIHLIEELTPHPASICEDSTDLPRANEIPSSKDLRSGQISDTNIQSPNRAKQRSQRYLTHIRLFFWIKKLLRPRLRPGYRRIEWTCDCGVELYGDFMLDKASDLDGLGLSLHMPAENTSTSSSSDSEQSVVTRTNPRHMISRSSSNRTALSTTSTDASSIDIIESKFLALCINTGGIYKTLAELDMSRINSDGEGFSQMKKAYIQFRGVRSRLRFLIKPVTVEFVRFTLWNLRRGYVSISDRPSSMPPNTRIDYDFVLPPMPPEVFVHYLEHGDGDLSPNRYTWLPRLPKRLNNKVMDCGEATEGWGIHVIEGPNREAVFLVLMITITASVLASVLWTTLKGDIQGGMGLGALIIALPPAIMAAFLFRLGAT